MTDLHKATLLVFWNRPPEISKKKHFGSEGVRPPGEKYF